MARGAHRSVFVPKNPRKYLGGNIDHIICRSNWERQVMLVFDQHPAIQWASESIKIPYVNPLTGKFTVYVPDFFVAYRDRNGVEHREVIEVKPQDELPWYGKKVSKLKESRQLVNKAKWQAAQAFCESRNWVFRIATEKDLFTQPKRK